MAFWGIEVRPGKPYTHIHDSTRGRLRVSQATLGNEKSTGSGKSTGKSTVQCNVGNKSPVLICSLILDVSETCHLELEFEEDDEVIFSVLGLRSVHLSGYFVGSGRDNGGNDTDSYGEDIAHTDSGESDAYSYGSGDDYDSDFIDDGDIEMFPSSPRRKSGVVIEEIVDDEKPANGKANRRRLKKKNQVSDSDDENAESERQLVVKGNRSAVLESEDDDGFPISISSRNKDDKTLDEDRKRKIDDISHHPESAKESCPPLDASAQPESGNVNSEKPKKKKRVKDRKPVETSPQSPAEKTVTADQNQTLDEKETTPNGDEVQLGRAVGTKEKDSEVEVDGNENSGKAKKKKKERVKKGKPSEIGVLSAERSDGESKGEPTGALNNDSMDQDIPSNVEPDKLVIDEVVDYSVPESSGKLKKRNKKNKHKDTAAETEGKAAPEENQQILEDKVDNTGNQQKKSDDAQKMDEDQLVIELSKDECLDVDAVKEQDSKKKKKKKSKNSDKDSNTNDQSVDMVVAEGTDDRKAGARSKAREFPNGLAIEDISMGKPDGKRASPGSKVFVHYTGKLQNGKVFDSSNRRKPFSFRLGIGEVIKGWDVGVKGMRVGDKRRLTVPPSMGYGAKGVGEIPGNAWLVFDVELVDVK